MDEHTGILHTLYAWGSVCILYYSTVTENKRSSIWQLCRHWWHRKLLKWQLTVPPMRTKLSNWRSFVFSDGAAVRRKLNDSYHLSELIVIHEICTSIIIGLTYSMLHIFTLTKCYEACLPMVVITTALLAQFKYKYNTQHAITWTKFYDFVSHPKGPIKISFLINSPISKLCLQNVIMSMAN